MMIKTPDDLISFASHLSPTHANLINGIVQDAQKDVYTVMNMDSFAFVKGVNQIPCQP